MAQQLCGFGQFPSVRCENSAQLGAQCLVGAQEVGSGVIRSPAASKGHGFLHGMPSLQPAPLNTADVKLPFLLDSLHFLSFYFQALFC